MVEFYHKDNPTFHGMWHRECR